MAREKELFRSNSVISDDVLFAQAALKLREIAYEGERKRWSRIMKEVDAIIDSAQAVERSIAMGSVEIDEPIVAKVKTLTAAAKAARCAAERLRRVTDGQRERIVPGQPDASGSGVSRPGADPG